MGQLQEVEKSILEGDVEAIGRIIDRLDNSSDFDMLYEAAGLLASYGFMREADRLYETLRTHMPDEAQLKIDRAGTLLELGEEDEALLLLTDVQPEDDEYVQALLALADYYQLSGMAEAALSKIKEAHALIPHEPVIRFAYAELLLDSGKFGEAMRHYLDLNEETDEIGGVSIVSRLAETYSAGAAYEEAIPYYEEMLQANPIPDTLFGAAFAYYQSDNAERAIVHLENLIDMDPDYFSAYMLAGQALARTGDDRKAYDMFTKGIRRDEFDKELQLTAGKSALKLGLIVEAEKHLQEALALDPEYNEALISLASLYSTMERDDELIDLLSYSKDEYLEVPLLEAFQAYAYERLEQFEDAYVSYSKAYIGMKDDQEFLEHFTKFLLEEGKRDEALIIAKELIEMDPNNDYWRAFLEAQNDEEV
ncbi:tetratricopeptide repeat protein [Sporosarcina limicola]|uniref:Tetratricopeptide (TPR) repeat protein n=1 Tax=Sporosarcina limicola TaxID=34101 RepID=A0A927MHY6_9BACL|nr:tetratricopeptide repeat protein [Sporosarcina limicola]MBE1554121.1 tetratricopeptide (TPR) repeat protein [Sporosarcina limicola]